MVDLVYKVPLKSALPLLSKVKPASAADLGIFKSLPNPNSKLQDIDSVPTQTGRLDLLHCLQCPCQDPRKKEKL